MRQQRKSKARRWRMDWMEEAGETKGDEVFVTEHESHSQLLGSDGEPLAYDKPPFGFDLTRRER